MAERAPIGGTEPFLFDRLAEHRRLAVEEDRGRASTVSSRYLREFVERDLVRLLSTSALETVEDLEQFPRTSRSVINFGLPGLRDENGRTATPESIAALVAQSIERFEPRLSRVRVTPLGEGGDTSLKLRIDAELWSRPQTQRFSLELEIDVISGSAKMQTGRRA